MPRRIFAFSVDEIHSADMIDIQRRLQQMGYGEFSRYMTSAALEKWQREHPPKHKASSKRHIPTGYEDATSRLEATKSMRKTIDRIKENSDAKTTRQAVDVAACYAKIGAVAMRFMEEKVDGILDEISAIESKAQAQKFMVKYNVDNRTLDSLLYLASDIAEERFLIPKSHLKPPIAHTLDIWQAKKELGEDDKAPYG